MFTTWGEMMRMFLKKFFPTSRTAVIRKEIYGIRQHSGEMLHKYWERFNKLCATCPHHQISEQLLLQYFYEGFLMMEWSMIDAASGGALMDKTPMVARHLISNMVGNMQQFGVQGGAGTSRVVSKVSTFDNLRICTLVEHPIDMWPTLQEDESDNIESVGALGGRHQFGRQLYPN
ncbi:hypothetical protein CR513_47705, partial [Mucuna pruriens]